MHFEKYPVIDFLIMEILWRKSCVSDKNAGSCLFSMFQLASNCSPLKVISIGDRLQNGQKYVHMTTWTCNQTVFEVNFKFVYDSLFWKISRYRLGTIQDLFMDFSKLIQDDLTAD